jgi:hypothetical protein
MTGALDRRLTRLERQPAAARATVHVWEDAGTCAQTDDIVAQQFPDGVPEGVRVVVYRWAIVEQTTVPSARRLA